MNRLHEQLGLIERCADDGSRVVVSRYAGQVLSWVVDGRERLYLSERAATDGRRPIRGGVPICFPQFSNRGSLPKHGIARTRRWTELSAQAASTISLRLIEDVESLRVWPHRFAVDLHAELRTHMLMMRMLVRNTGSEPFSFTAALHSYLRVVDLPTSRLTGLQGLRTEDALRGASSALADESPDLSVPIDSIYYGVAKPLELRTQDARLRIEQSGFEDAVVWNPGPKAAAQLDDIDPEDSSQFLCVEAAQVGRPVLVEPGQTWTGTQTLCVV